MHDMSLPQVDAHCIKANKSAGAMEEYTSPSIEADNPAGNERSEQVSLKDSLTEEDPSSESLQAKTIKNNTNDSRKLIIFMV